MKVLIVAKRSKYEWERFKFNLSHDEIVAKYNKEHANLNAILTSHDNQFKVRSLIGSAIPQSKICFMDDVSDWLSDKAIKDNGWDLIIVLGGDNSFTYVSHWAAEIPILGINSDPDRSVGCLTRYAIREDQDVYDLVEILNLNEFDIQKWPRLTALVDNKYVIPSAASEYFLGERRRKDMSRHILVVNGQEYEQKCSGLIVATGAGSTGWYRSSTCLDSWAPKERVARFAAMEPYSGDMLRGELKESDEIILYSLNDADGCVSADSWEEADFPRGSEAKIHFGLSLNVVVPRRYIDGR